MLEKLNEQQTAQLDITRDKWINNLYSGPVNREYAQKTMEFLYKLISKPTPNIVYVESPFAMQYAYTIYNLLCDYSKSELARLQREYVIEQHLENFLSEVTDSLILKLTRKNRVKITRENN